MSAASFTIREAGGRVVGPVAIQGNGGPIAAVADARHRVDEAIRRAGAGHSLGLCEPATGHARAYVYRADGDTDDTLLDLRGATLLEVSVHA